MTRTFSETGEFIAFASERAAALAMDVEQLPLLGLLAPDWIVSHDSVRRMDMAFFQLLAFRIVRAAGREFPRWLQPLLKDAGGYIGLIVAEDSGKKLVLVRMKAEPGNKGIGVDGKNTRVLVSAPLQFSWSNIQKNDDIRAGKVEGGKVTPLAHLHNDDRLTHQKEEVPEDGGRFWEKVNMHDLLTAPNVEAIEKDIQEDAGRDDFAWITVDVLVELRKYGLLNGHLHSIMAMLVE